MVSEDMKEFVKVVKEKNFKKARSLIRDIIDEKGDISKDIEDIPNVSTQLAEKIKEKGYDSLGKLANAPLDGLVKLPELAEGPAKKVFDSAQRRVLKDLTVLPGVGEGTAKEMINHGYTSLESVSRSSVEKLSQIPGIGGKGAEKILETAKEEAVTNLEDLPGVGDETAEKMREESYTPLNYLAESSVEELTNIPNIGKTGAEEILEYSEDNPKDDIEDLPGVGRETAEEIRKFGYTAIQCVANSTEEELSKIPNIGGKGAEKILEYAREKAAGSVENIPEINQETVDILKNHGYNTMEDIASSSIEKLIKIPKLRKGKAKEVKESAQELLRKSGGDTQGYERALKGIITSLKEERTLSLPLQILENKYSEEKLQDIKKEMKTRASHVFRSPDEKSYYEAWTDLLDAFLELKEDNN